MLGNNYGADKEVFEEYLEQIVDRLAPRPTVLLTVTEFRPDRADVNEAIYEIAADFANVRIVDWASETALAPGLLGGDGLHLSDTGRQRYADLVGRALGRAPGFGEGDCLGSDFTDDAAITPTEGQVTMPPSTWPNNTGGNSGGGGGGGGPTTPPVDTTPPDTLGPTVPVTTAPEVTQPQPSTTPPTPSTPATTQPQVTNPPATTAAPQPTTAGA
jgi:hypothetical protein